MTVTLRPAAAIRKHGIPLLLALCAIAWCLDAWRGNYYVNTAERAAAVLQQHIGHHFYELEESMRAFDTKGFDVVRDYRPETPLQERRYMLIRPSTLYAWAEYEPDSKIVRDAGLVYALSEQLDMNRPGNLPGTDNKLNIAIPVFFAGIALWYAALQAGASRGPAARIATPLRAAAVSLAILSLYGTTAMLAQWALARFLG